MTEKIVEPGELVLRTLTIRSQLNLEPGEWVTVRKDWEQRMRVLSKEDGEVLLVWP